MQVGSLTGFCVAQFVVIVVVAQVLVIIRVVRVRVMVCVAVTVTRAGVVRTILVCMLDGRVVVAGVAVTRSTRVMTVDIVDVGVSDTVNTAVEVLSNNLGWCRNDIEGSHPCKCQPFYDDDPVAREHLILEQHIVL